MADVVCMVCGAKNYPLSFGGPDICPECDCGTSGGVRLSRLRQELAAANMRADAAYAKGFEMGATEMRERAATVAKSSASMWADARSGVAFEIETRIRALTTETDR